MTKNREIDKKITISKRSKKILKKTRRVVDIGAFSWYDIYTIYRGCDGR